MLLSRSEPIGGVQGMASNFLKLGLASRGTFRIINFVAQEHST